MPSFDITRAEGTRTCVIRLVGDVDTAMVPELQSRLADVLGSGCENIVLDLTEVIYADSSALGLLVWIDRHLAPHKGRLVLAGANPDVARILEISGLVTAAASIATSTDVQSALGGLDMPATPSVLLWGRLLDVPADVNSLSGVREEVGELVAPLGFPEAEIFDIKVALGEALANALRHGRPEIGDERVSLGIEAYGDRLVLEVTDNGVGFDGTAANVDDLYAPSGRGVMFMHALMDRVDFDAAPGGGTVVRLTKHRPCEAR